MAKTYIYETHLHTNHSSACGQASGAQMVDYYKEKGYQGIVVTEHFMNGNSSVPETLSWEEQIDRYALGYHECKRRGDEVGFDVFFGIEYNFRSTEFLIYGIEVDWLKDHPEIMQPNLVKALKLFKNAGATLIHAHPFREDTYIEMLRLLPWLTDAVEVYNCGNLFRNPAANRRAFNYAAEYGLPMCAGSDAHVIESSAMAGVVLNHRAKSLNDLAKCIVRQECDLYLDGKVYKNSHKCDFSSIL